MVTWGGEGRGIMITWEGRGRRLLCFHGSTLIMKIFITSSKFLVLFPHWNDITLPGRMYFSM